MAIAFAYGQFESVLNSVIIEDVVYQWTPDGFIFDTSEFGIRSKSNAVLDNARVVTTQSVISGTSWIANDVELFQDARLSLGQAVTLTWSTKGFTTMCMRDHLYTLYTTQKKFWLQCDDDMSYDLALLTATDTSYQYYITPTYPIGFMRNRDTSSPYTTQYDYIQVYKNGVVLDWESNPWRFDTKTGLMWFATPMLSTDAIQLKYVWRMYVRVVTASVDALDIAQNTYGGSVVLEQVDPPANVSRWDDSLTAEETRECLNPLVASEDTMSVAALYTCMGYKSAASTPTVSSRSAGVTWINLGNTTVLDGAYASSGTLSGGQQTYLLNHSNFIPDSVVDEDAAVPVIRVRVSAYASPDNGAAADIIDDTVQLTVAGTPVGDNIATQTPLTNTVTDRIYEFTNTTGITPEDINNGLVGVNLGYTDTPVSSVFSSGNWTIAVARVDDTTGSDSANACLQTEFTLTATYTGSGTAPSYVVVNVTGSCTADNNNTPPATADFVGFCSVDNGMGAFDSGSLVVPATNPPPASRVATTTVKVKLRTAGGVGTYTTTMYGSCTMTSTSAGNAPEIVNALSGSVVTPDSATANVDLVQMSVCASSVSASVSSLCQESSSTVSQGTVSNTITSSCATYDAEFTFTGFNIPVDNYITGIEVSNFTVAYDSPCPPGTLGAQIWARYKLDGLSDTYTSWYKKLNQDAGSVNQAYVGVVDPTTNNFAFGNVCDLWGKSFGAYAPTQINTYGLKIEAFVGEPSNGCGAYDGSNWSLSTVYSGTSVTIDASNVTNTVVWASNGSNVSVGGSTYKSAACNGTVTFGATWTGSGSPPTYVDVDVVSSASASSATASSGASAMADNGLGNVQNVTTTGSTAASASVSGTKRVRFFIDPAGNTIIPFVITLSTLGDPALGITAATAATTTNTVASCTLSPSITNLSVTVWHTQGCQTKPMPHLLATSGGSWNTALEGVSGSVAQTSDGTSTGTFTLKTSGFDFASQNLFVPGAHMVGISYSMEARRSSVTGSTETAHVRAQVSSYNSGLSYRNFTLPQTPDWTTITVGGANDMWGFSSADSITGTLVPTMEGTDLNNLFNIEFSGTNISGVWYEFRNMVTTIYYVDIC